MPVSRFTSPPLQAEDFALAHPYCNGYGKDGFQSVTADCV